MWAAANDSSNRRRHNNNKRSRKNDNDTNNSDYEYSSSDDDEHSTTESISEGISNALSYANNNLGGTSSTLQSSGLQSSSNNTSHAPSSNNLQHKPSNKHSRSKRHKKKHKQQIGETAEATIARLKTTYSTAISAVGELHSVSRKYCNLLDDAQQQSDENVSSVAADGDNAANEDNNDTNIPQDEAAATSISRVEEEAYQSLQKAANTARSTLETSLLLDSIILSSILTTSSNKTTQSSYTTTGGVGSSSSSAWLDTYTSTLPSSNTTSNKDKKVVVSKKWTKLSKAHQSSIRQISYLILVNYADLLLSGIVGTKSDVGSSVGDGGDKKSGVRSEDMAGKQGGISKGMDILDKGAITKLGILSRLSSFSITTSSQRTSSDEMEVDSPPSTTTTNNNNNNGLWSTETNEQTIHLALSAYCDATELDSSDPTLWYKLACAARLLGREVDNNTHNTVRGEEGGRRRDDPPMKYRCLERLAIEHGLSVLPLGVPPNRMLLRAWKEMERWDHQAPVLNRVVDAVTDDEPVPQKEDKPTELVLNLPKYSWVTLGNILLQACNEGISFGQAHISEDDEFGSPLVNIQISPLLGVPFSVLECMSKYLDEGDIKRMRCVCKEFESSSALGEVKKKQLDIDKEAMGTDVEEDDTGVSTADEGTEGEGDKPSDTPSQPIGNPSDPLLDAMSTDDDSPPTKESSSPMASSPLKLARLSAGVTSPPKEVQQQQELQPGEGFEFNGHTYPTYQEMVAAKRERNRKVLERATGDISAVLGSEYNSKDSNKPANNKPKPTKKKRSKSSSGTERVSKRVRSQMLTSEKQTERKSKRGSVEYCLLAGALSCTAQNPYYTKLLKEDLDKDHLPLITQGGMILNSPARKSSDTLLDSDTTSVDQITAFITPTSLNSFVTKWSRHNSGPRNLAEIFLIHVSLNVGEVFEVENTDSISSCVLDCFNAMISSAGRQAELMPWYGEESLDETSDVPASLSVLAVNLLNAELRFKRSETYDIGSDEQQEGSDVLAFMIPKLVQLVEEIQSQLDSSTEHDTNQQLLELQCRCYWLASAYYLQSGRICNESSIAKAAEDLGLDYLNKVMTIMSNNNSQQQIKTPHLQSSTRHEDYWSTLSMDTLSKYKEYIQSSAIVSSARQRFSDIQNEVSKRSQSTTADTEETANAITEDDKAKYSSLGLELLDRYDINGEKASELINELLKDLLLLHEDQLNYTPDMNDDDNVSTPRSKASTWNGMNHWGRLWTEIPSSTKAVTNTREESSRPSIIQVLASSLVVSGEKISSLLLMFSKLALSAVSQVQATQQDDSSEKKDDQVVDGQAPSTTNNSRAGHAKKNHLLVLVVNFFIDKMNDLIISYTDQADMISAMENHVTSQDFNSLVLASLNVIPFVQDDSTDDSSLHMNIFKSVSRLVHTLRDCQGLSSQAREKVESVYFSSLVKSLTRQKKDFAELTKTNDKRLKKWQVSITSQADLVFFKANEIAELLSLNPTRVNKDGSAEVSHLMKAITGQDGEGSNSTATLAQFASTLLWFWNYLSNAYDILSPTELSIRDRLMVPIVSSIVGLCGSPGVSVEPLLDSRDDTMSSDNKSSSLSLSDFFESDDSVNGLFLHGSSSEENQQQRSRRVLLRKICQLVQCVSLVLKSVNLKLMRQEEFLSTLDFPSSQHGPFLPLVTIRVLSSMSESLFALFSVDIADVAYPYGARECGSMIDSLLGRAYSHLYGFSFVSTESFAPKSYAPESIKAATRLFRCIKRVYNANRKAPPTKAWETVELALPPIEESQASKAIKAFLLDANKNIDMPMNDSTDDLPRGCPEWVFDVSDSSSSSDDDDKQHDSIELLRRGVAHELAKGEIADLESPSTEDDQGLSIERESTQRHELNLYQNFRAVLNDLCYRPNNVEGWVKLSECIGFKAEDICDRIVRIQDPYDSSEFCLTDKSKRKQPAMMSLDQLKQAQEEEFQVSQTNWKPFIGNDLLIYMKYPWSNLSSLEAFAKEVGLSISPAVDNADGTMDEGSNTEEGQDNSDYLCWKEIQSKFEEGKYVEWANSWAGMYVTALRTMRLKALLVARYLAKKNKGDSRASMHPSEVCEDVGTALYSELMASTVYGYPIHPMLGFEKRRTAERCNFYFQEAVELSTSTDYTQKCQTVSHELHFMIGKCYEKIASTLKEEKYPLVTSQEGDQSSRLYETTMHDAIVHYSKASTEAQAAEKASGGGPDKSCLGGSSHGAIEYLYRLHASRFKVFLSAIKRAKEECELAVLEAFRITSVKWFDESNESSSSSLGVRGKTWDVFADCVDAFTHCRRVMPVFHRAAYRLAQAYNYAPLFHDPETCNVGSKQAIPTIKSYRIRGLDNGSCSESANAAISKLFDKKRSQLAAVWVTTSSSPSPYEVLNDSLRKYDALRLKYIRAYIDCNKETEQGRRDIETLLTWTMTSNQDLAGFYIASALLRGGDPGKHAKQSRLTSDGFIANVKHACSSAMTEMILRDLAVWKRKNGINNDEKKKLTAHFKLAYKLHLNLNASSKEVAEHVSKNGPLAEVEAFCKCYLSIQSGYRISSINLSGMDSAALCSILEGALAKGKQMMQEAKVKVSKKKEKTVLPPSKKDTQPSTSTPENEKQT